MNCKSRLAVTLLALSTTFNVFADVSNGDFETWVGGLPASWTTIDSGIDVSQNTNIVKTNLNSAAITVNTGTQGSTDFRQVLSVISGQSYEFSTWVYHTEGGIKARLYVDGYQNYSDPGQINQWQQIAYTYTASSSKNISIGLRFYDISGFDGSEVVYIDNFQPTNVGTPPIGGGCEFTEVTLSLTTDNYGGETSWTLDDSNQVNVASGSGYQNNTNYQENFCLDDGDYNFTIDDSFGDGICCSYGIGSYELLDGTTSLISGASFTSSESKTFTIGSTTPPGGGPGNGDPGSYYDSITTQTAYALKTALHTLIKNHSAQGYSALWTFYENNSLDTYYENDGSILDIYSENPNGNDSYNYTKVINQCGTYNSEADCYNREHSFPRSWFGGKVEPMNSDVHHIFATDGYVNSKRSSYPYGEVGSASYVSNNNSKVGSSTTTGYSGTVFEPIDEFKGDLARAYFYMATRYQDVISSWETKSSSGDLVLNGSADQVFEIWQLNMLLSWHNSDPVSQKEIDRNEAAYSHQGNRNPYIDHPEYVDSIWVN